ncbi:protein spinster isoform X2 [Leptopilina boulardi]|uniref:protein spinster isoform X2 n=1 Tax=Leptopilina boulardi TaxID=63433 RepID=UPI0021F573A7|nr:protein spinster isoform X2 [Leptopilina boulardi]
MDEVRIRPTVSNQQLMINAEQEISSSSREIKNSTNTIESRTISLKEWITVLILCYVNLINYMDRFTIAGILDDVKDEFHISNGEAGLLQTAFIISYMAFAPIFGYLGDRYNRKILMALGVFLWCLTTFIGSYMKAYGWFLVFRAMVGVGEASYSTIAPTIISDLFVKDVRSKMLALFYFAIPVGSGLGYIIGGETAKATGSWQWGLRITPILGIVAIILILLLVRDPIRGEREGGTNIVSTSWADDIRSLVKNHSFMLSTAGFTCVSFVTGALAWWGPTFLKLGLKLELNDDNVDQDDVAYKFGLTAMVAGLLGVPLGSIIAQKLRVYYTQTDPLICAFGLLISTPLVFFGIVMAGINSTACYILIFFGQVAININWSIVADMLLYVVIPTRRSSAEALQILIAHALGDAGSPYIIGVLSEGIKSRMMTNVSSGVSNLSVNNNDLIEYRSLQYSLFITVFIEVIGSLFFFITALYIQKDKALVDLTVADESDSETSFILEEEGENRAQNPLVEPD